ncbi:acetyltransferase [Frondihabitans sp. PAMC 28766]|uniref:GNAT family N-acetyltransferase n=1 Tax=Frondihabitans sp. PAMC 28766 TaxID=1795630 RepID=UPI00078B665B|nr:GNAT family N-acetyltransferase [Frondihabitans sp. PAMC 28766]AMM20604.1 acetyltransferase [Frondihabitans sp. PAMC 28766]
MTDAYLLVPTAPPLVDYLRLRRAAGLSVRSPEQAGPALENSWAFCHVVSTSGEVAAMGRIIGDGGWYFHVADMATLPDHQRRGLGRRVLEWLLAQVDERAPAGALVNLIADPPGQPLYEKLGFRWVGPDAVGMTLNRP